MDVRKWRIDGGQHPHVHLENNICSKIEVGTYSVQGVPIPKSREHEIHLVLREREAEESRKWLISGRLYPKWT